MPCQLSNHSEVDLSSLEPHVQGMYDFFDQKIGFKKPPTMHFDSDPSNRTNVLGKTAYYDPSTLEIHIFTDGRHPKDMLRSIAHELVHHQQNLEDRLDVGGFMGQGYYLQNEAMKELEQEAMLKGNALMREYEDTTKSEEINKMSLKEWKNNELNRLLLEKFGILKEEKEITHMCALEVTHKTSGQIGHPIRHTLSESGAVSHYTVEFKNVIVENIAVENLDVIQQEVHTHKRDDDKDHDEKKPVVSEQELEEAKGKFDDGDGEDEKCDHVPCGDQVKEEGQSIRRGAEDRDVGRDRAREDRMHEAEEEEQLYRYDKDGKIVPVSKAYKMGQKVGKFLKGEKNEEMNEEGYEPGGEDHFFYDPEGAADRYRKRPKPEEKKDSLQERDAGMRAKMNRGRKPLEEALKKIINAKSITLKSSGKKIK